MPNWCYNHLEISSWNSYSLPDEYTELKTGSKKKSDYDMEIENRKKDAGSSSNRVGFRIRQKRT